MLKTLVDGCVTNCTVKPLYAHTWHVTPTIHGHIIYLDFSYAVEILHALGYGNSRMVSSEACSLATMASSQKDLMP